jgi:hypothetical protein
MKYTVEMGLSAMKGYMTSFIKMGSAIQKLIEETHRQHGDRISLHLFKKTRKVS